MENVSSLEQFRRNRQVAQEKLVALDEAYPYRSIFMLMQPHQIFEELKGDAVNALYSEAEDRLNHLRIHTLLEMTRLVFEGIFTPFEIKLKPFVRYDPVSRYYSIVVCLVDLPSSAAATDGAVIDPTVLKFFIEEYRPEEEERGELDTGMARPAESLNFSFPTSSLSPRLPRQMVKNMISLIAANGGWGDVTETGYTVVLPNVNGYAICMGLLVKDPVALIQPES